MSKQIALVTGVGAGDARCGGLPQGRGHWGLLPCLELD